MRSQLEQNSYGEVIGSYFFVSSAGPEYESTPSVKAQQAGVMALGIGTFSPFRSLFRNTG